MTDEKQVILFDIDYTLFDTDTYKASNLTEFLLYPEVQSILDYLRQKAILGIFSEGEIDFQHNKLEKTNIRQFFQDEHTHVVLKKSDALVEVLEKYKNRKVMLIDDKLTILYEAKKQLPSLVTVWVKRGVYAENQETIAEFEPDYIIKSLEELENIVTGNMQQAT